MIGRIKKVLLPDPRRSAKVARLALPVMAAMLVQTFINLFDTIIIGLLPREYSIAGQAGLGYTVILHWLIGGFASCISVGTQAMTARRFGEQDLEGAGKVLFNSLFVAFLVGATFSVLATSFAGPIFRLVTSNEHVLAQGIPYAKARFAGILAMVCTLACKAFFDGLGKTHYHLIVAIIMNAINALLAYLLVFGVGGLPRLNVFGAGLAAMIASYLGMFLILGIALWPKYSKEFKIFRLSNLDLGVAMRILRLSIPSGVATVFVMTGFLLFYKWVGLLDSEVSLDFTEGDRASVAHWMQSILPFTISKDAFLAFLTSRPPVYEAATKVIIDLLSISFMTCIGLGVATATLVSQSLGGKRPDEAEAYGWTAVRLAVWFTGTVGLATLIFPDAFMGIFSHDPEVIEAGRTPLRVIACGEFLLGFGLVLAQALFGAGATRFVMKVEIILHTLCLVPLSYLFGVVFHWRLVGLWISALLYIVCLASAMTWKFARGSWKAIKI